MEKEMIFTLSVMESGDSVLRIGKNLFTMPTYYGEYTDALEAIKDKVENELLKKE